MRERLVSTLVSIYRAMLSLYPRHFREAFGAEMTAVFRQRVEDAAAGGGWVVLAVCLRELRDIPRTVATAYHFAWLDKWQQGLELLRDVTPVSDLPPPPPDGRESWRQVGAEVSLFLVAGLLLLGVTYLPLDGPGAGWQRDLGLLGKVITPLTLPVFLLGLARGLPRWAYPSGGLLLGTHALRAGQSGLWPFLVAMLLAYAILGVAALVTDPQPSPLPAPLRRIGRSVALDWTRLSFGVYGAAPLAILRAFDDGHANDRTPYLALAVLGMVACALFYCRSRQRRMQIGALLGGIALAMGAAWLDMVAFVSGAGARLAVPFPGRAEISWMLSWWLLWMALILAPALLGRAGSAIRLKRAV